MKLKLAVISLIMLIACSASAQVWEFSGSTTDGWSAANGVANLAVVGGCLTGNITNMDPYMNGPAQSIDASANPYIVIRMKITTGTMAQIYWQTPEKPYYDGDRIICFGIYPDNQFHEYIIEASKFTSWTGTVNSLRFDPADDTNGHFEVDYIRVLPNIPPMLTIAGPSTPTRFATTGQAFDLAVTIRNDGTQPATNLRATLSAPGCTVLTSSPLLVSSIAGGTETKLIWQVQADTTGIKAPSVMVTTDTPGGTVTSKSMLVICNPLPSIPADAPTQAQAWKDASNTAVIENDKVRLAFYKSSAGYLASEFYVRNGSNWELIGAASPLSRVSYVRSGGTISEFSINPSQVSVQRIDNSAVLDFTCSVLDSNYGSWSGHIIYTLKDGDDAVKARFTLKCSSARNLAAWVGPSLCAGNGSFGASKSQALFPGLEWLDGNDPQPGGSRSSNTLECDFSHSLRLVPHPYRVTVPLMAVSGNGCVAAILWDPMQKWDGANAYPSAKFSSPNWYEGQDNHLMELFLPSIPNWVPENSCAASTPYALAANSELSMECYYFAKQGEVLDAVDKWYALYGMPPVPGSPNLLESGLATARQAFMNTLWDSEQKGWKWRLVWPSDVQPHPEFIAHLFADSLSETDPTVKAALRARVNEAVDSALTQWGSIGLSRGPYLAPQEYRLPYFVGQLNEAAIAMAVDANYIRSIQQSDGSWLVPPCETRPDLTTPPNLKELGPCALFAKSLLRYARISGSAVDLNAGIKGLEYMNRFVVPRASYWVELPQHTPDIQGPAFAISSYIDGYLLTGNTAYLEKAKYWARAGLQFVYTWKASDRAMMDYSTICGYGASTWNWPWFGLPVQWLGMLYAYYVDRIADYDDSFPWRTVSEGITRSCIQQMNASPYLGTFGDSLNLVPHNKPREGFQNPEQIYRSASHLLGRWGDINMKTIRGAARTASVSTAGRILLGNYVGSSQLNVKIQYPVSETCHILIYGTGLPTAVYVDGTSIPKVSDADSVSQGWSYNPTYGCIVIKEVHASEIQMLRVLINGALTAVNSVAGPAEAKAIADNKPVMFSGVVTSGNENYSNGIYVESQDRTSAIRVCPTVDRARVAIGDSVEILGCLASSLGERYIAQADVRILP